MAYVSLGDQVLAPWMNDGFLYPGILVTLSPQTAHVAFFDGDEGDAALAAVRPIQLAAGQRVQINWKGRGNYYHGTIQQVVGPAMYLHYDDGDKGWATIGQLRVPAG